MELTDPTRTGVLHERILDWYDVAARDLPWRRPEATPWGVLVSEVMLQQTPVARVLPVWETWLATWPTPADLVDAGPGEAVRAWGRLGYPRRALRLHAAAVAIVERHNGEVPDDHEALLALPGVGEYTAAAVASFAFGQRHPVLDTNVRRVFARVAGGTEHPGTSVTRTERDLATRLLPEHPPEAATWAVAVMELGALVCTAARPRCEACPVEELCRWRQAGHPAHDGPPRRGQSWAGTDRQCRGRLLEVLRSDPGPVHRSRLDAVWHDEAQRSRCLESLVADGLAVRVSEDVLALPG
jgi:A/G-specific adenine glycosylase